MEKNLTNIVNRGDRICASLDCNGRRLASINAAGFSSLDTVKKALLDMAGYYVGMAVISVRNCTQGWRDITALASMRNAVLESHTAQSAPRQGRQYLIPWAS